MRCCEGYAVRCSIISTPLLQCKIPSLSRDFRSFCCCYKPSPTKIIAEANISDFGFTRSEYNTYWY